MRYLIIGFMLVNTCLFAQIREVGDSTLRPICIERGHINAGLYTSTLMYCPPYFIETDSTTVKVYPACNWIEYTCERCGDSISEREKERMEIIWKRK